MKRSVGWLWYDDDPASSLEEKVKRAAKRYHKKFGREATACYVNEAHTEKLIVEEITVMGVADLLRHHFWLEGERE